MTTTISNAVMTAQTESTEKSVMSNTQVNNKIECQFLYKGEWGGYYDPETETLLGGYSVDGKTFSPDFQITEIEGKYISTAMDICISLYSEYGTIVSTMESLLENHLTEKERTITETVIELRNSRGKREVIMESESEPDTLSDNEKEIMQEIANRMGEKIYTGNHWDGLVHVFTINDLIEDFSAYIEGCEDEEDTEAYISLNDYVTYFFKVFKPNNEEVA